MSHETIYLHLWADKENGGTLWRRLRGARKLRRKRYGYNDSRGRLAGKKMIGERPAIVERRTRLGDWEIDTVHGRGKPATVTVVILSLIGGLRSFELIWAMTKGGPGFTSDVIASVIYKQYQAGFYGLSTAGNVILFLLVTAIIFPLSRFLNRKEVDL